MNKEINARYITSLRYSKILYVKWTAKQSNDCKKGNDINYFDTESIEVKKNPLKQFILFCFLQNSTG